MLKIIINNREVDLGKLKGITLQNNGGVFEFDKIEGSYTIPFNLPLSDINRDIFEYPLRIEGTNNEIREYNAEIWHSGILMLTGKIISKNFNNKNISCKIFGSNGNLYKKINSKKLPEHNYGGDKPFTMKDEYDYLTDDFVLYQVKNEDFCVDSAWDNTDANNYIETDEVGTASIYVDGYEGITGWDKLKVPKLWFSIEDTGSNIILFGFETEADRDAHTHTKFLVYEGTNDVQEFSGSGYDGTLEFSVGANDGDKLYVSSHEYLNFQNYITQDDEFLFDEDGPCIITPFPLLWRTLKYLFENLGYNYIDNYFTQDNFKRINIFNINNAVQWFKNSSNEFKNKLETVNIANHLPNIDTGEFLIAIQNFFNVLFLVKGDTVTVINRDEVITSSEFEDFTNKKTQGLKKTLKNTVEGYSIRIGNDGSDEISNNFAFKNYGDNESIEYKNLIYDKAFYETNETGSSSSHVSNYDLITGWNTASQTTIWVKVINESGTLYVYAYETKSDRDSGLNAIFKVEENVTTVIELNTSGYGGDLFVDPGIVANDTFFVEYKEIRMLPTNLPAIAEAGDIIHNEDLYYEYVISYSGGQGGGTGWIGLPISSWSANLWYFKRNFKYFQSFSDGDKGFILDCKLSTLADIEDINGDEDENTFRNPVTKQKGNMYIRKEIQDFSLRLLTYNVQVYEGGGINPHPFGLKKYGDVEISSYWSYLRNKNLIEWTLKNTETYEVDFILSASEIKHFDFTKKKLIDRNLFFIKSFKVQLLRNAITPAKAILIKAD